MLVKRKTPMSNKLMLKPKQIQQGEFLRKQKLKKRLENIRKS